MLRPVLALSLVACLVSSSWAQDRLPVPPKSPHVQHAWSLGITEISVDFHAPSVRGREIWGVKVPYDVVWRAGANANTVLTFEHDVSLEGQPVPAGSYGLHMLPGAERFTIILSKNTEGWGSYGYTQEQDLLRAEVTPREAASRERLDYLLDDVSDSGGTLALHWGQVYVPMQVEVDLAAVVLAPVRELAASGGEGPGWQYWFQAADYGRDHGVLASEGLAWIERSIEHATTFTNLWSRSELLADLERVEEAGAAREQALELVTVDELSSLGSRYADRGDLQSAGSIYDMVMQMGSPNWWDYTRIATVRERLGDVDGAKAALEQALTRNPDPVARAEIEASLAHLSEGSTG